MGAHREDTLSTPGGNDVPPAHGMRHRTALTLLLGGGRCPQSVLGTPWACQRPGEKPVKNAPEGALGWGPPLPLHGKASTLPDPGTAGGATRPGLPISGAPPCSIDVTRAGLGE